MSIKARRFVSGKRRRAGLWMEQKMEMGVLPSVKGPECQIKKTKPLRGDAVCPVPQPLEVRQNLNPRLDSRGQALNNRVSHPMGRPLLSTPAASLTQQLWVASLLCLGSRASKKSPTSLKTKYGQTKPLEA